MRLFEVALVALCQELPGYLRRVTIEGQMQTSLRLRLL